MAGLKALAHARPARMLTGGSPSGTGRRHRLGRIYHRAQRGGAARGHRSFVRRGGLVTGHGRRRCFRRITTGLRGPRKGRMDG